MPRKSNPLSKINFKLKHMEMLLIAIVLIIGIIIMIVIDRRHNQHSNVTQSILNNGVEESNQDKVLMLFYAEWCGASRQFLPVWDEIVETSNIKTEKINVDKNNELAKEYNIKYLPTLYLVNGNNRIKYEGQRTKNNILEFVSKQ